MKKWLCLALVGMLLLCCTACDGKLFSPVDSSSNLPPASTPKKTEFTTSQGGLTYTVSSTQKEDVFELTKTLTITDTISAKTIQTFLFSENEWFTKDPLYLTDITFDGNVDLLVPLSRSASGAYFEAYVWDVGSEQYHYAPSFKNLPNIARDTANKTLLSHRTSDQITSYGIYKYSVEKKDFVSSYSLYWEPHGNQQTMHVKETEYTVDGEKGQSKDFFVSATTTGIDKTDVKMIPYFSDNSIWDLDNDKWYNALIDVSTYIY